MCEILTDESKTDMEMERKRERQREREASELNAHPESRLISQSCHSMVRFERGSQINIETQAHLWPQWSHLPFSK